MHDFQPPEIVTLPVTDIDYSEQSAQLNAEIIHKGYISGYIPETTLITGCGFQLCNQSDTLNIFIDNTELGVINYHLSELPFPLPIKVRAFITIDDDSVMPAYFGNFVELYNLYLEIPEAAIAAHTTDIGYGEWETIEELCRESRIGGYDDWRIPNRSELYVLYNEKTRLGFENECYWSSDLADTYHFYSIHFRNGDLTTYNGKHLGRCVRSLNL